MNFAVFKSTYFTDCLRTVSSAASELVRYYMYICLSDLCLEEEKEYENYLRINHKCFDKLFVHLKDDIAKWTTNMRDASTPKLKFAAETFHVHSSMHKHEAVLWTLEKSRNDQFFIKGVEIFRNHVLQLYWKACISKSLKVLWLQRNDKKVLLLLIYDIPGFWEKHSQELSYR